MGVAGANREGGDPRLQVSHAGIEIYESKGWR
jgi:hypothetical protein